MSVRITVPLVSANAADVTITAWNFEPGEEVTCGETLLEVTTDKAAFEIEAPRDGTLLQIFAPLRSVVPVGYIVALIGLPGEEDSGVEAANAAITEQYQREVAGQAPLSGVDSAVQISKVTVSPSVSPKSVRATPKARRLAVEKGLDLQKVSEATGAKIITETVLAEYCASAG